MQFHLTKSLENSQTYQSFMPYMHMKTPIYFAPLFYESTMTYISKTWNMHWCAQTKLVSKAPSLTTPLPTLIIQELLHSRSQLEITPSLQNNMVLRRTFASDIYHNRNLNIALSFTSQMRINSIPTRHPISLFNHWLLISPDQCISSISVLKPKDRLMPEYSSHIWHCSLETAKQNLVATTCKQYREKFRRLADRSIP